MRATRTPVVRIVLLVTMTLLLAPLARAQADDDFKEIVDALNAKDYASVWEDLRPLMNEGNGRAFYIAGVLTAEGHGVPADPAKAVELYRKGAEAGFDPAMNNLDIALKNGEGVAKDPVEALKWFEKATRLNNDMAPFNAGMMYVNGQGTARDYVEGYAHYLLTDDAEAKQFMAELEQKVLSPADVERARQRAKEIARERETMTAKSRADAEAAAANGTFPIKLATNDKGQLVVTGVDPSLSAKFDGDMADCCAKVEDVLTEVDNKSVEGMTAQQASELLKGRVGSNIMVRFKREGLSGDVLIATPRLAAKAPASTPVSTNTKNPLAVGGKKLNPLAQLSSTPTPTSMADADTYTNSEGRWSLNVPADWDRRENPTEKVVQFKHPRGARIEVRLVSLANGKPFKTRYDVSMCDRDKKWLGPAIELHSSKSSEKIGDAEACSVRFSEDWGGSAMLGKGFYLLSGTEGLVITLKVPADQARELGPKLDEIAATFKLMPR